MSKELFKKYQITPSKRLGQNFMTNKGVIKKIIETAELSPNDIVLEIGPGLGALTWGLAKKAKRVIAVEKDPKLVEILKETSKDFDNIEIVQGDIRISDFLNIDNRKSDAQKYKIVANLPFYLTAPVIRQFLETKNPPEEMVLVVQKEVAQRICAKPPDMNLLAVSVQFYSQPKIISYISKKSFWPPPKVDSAILKIAQIHIDKKIDSYRFFKIVKAGFSQPRKQLVNNLSRGLKTEREKIVTWLLKNSVQPTQRAETLTLVDWINLSKSCTIL